ncbi:hypothetical protein Mgrana_00792 [Meiothermus granaticius NBRC 107808]|uniref:Uncharacterized protein n=2 Tax=Meiothermus TaxID=65551 RepID=A0A399FAV7_9DEIN|nr:hypothetical protein Mgrana_00792 [Meiothermus granaticius NBRC 107808]
MGERGWRGRTPLTRMMIWMKDVPPAIKTFKPVLEESLEYFWEQFSSYALPMPLSPEPLGSPLLEVLTPLGPVWAFDRGLTPIGGESPPILLHGQVERWEPEPMSPPLRYLGGGRYQVSGRVVERLGGAFFLLRIGGGAEALTLLLADLEPPPVGAEGTAWLAPPLMAFRP